MAVAQPGEPLSDRLKLDLVKGLKAILGKKSMGTTNAAVGSIATEPFRACADLCPLLSKSDHSMAEFVCPRSAIGEISRLI